MDSLTIFLGMGLVLGILVVIYDIKGSINDKKIDNPVAVDIENYSLLQLGSVLYQNKITRKKVVLAEIFDMAKKGKIKFISKIDEGLLGIKNTEIVTEIISEHNLSEEQKEIMKGLKKYTSFKEFFKDNKLYDKIFAVVENKLRENELISRANVQIRKRIIIFSIIFFYIPAVIFGSIAIMNYRPLLYGIMLFFLVVGTGRLVKITTIPVLSKKGLSLKKRTDIYLEEKKQELENEIEKNPDTAAACFFENLPLLILHKKFNKPFMKKFKKKLKAINEFNVPEWLELDTSYLEKSLEAMDILETIDYAITSTIFIATTAGIFNSTVTSTKEKKNNNLDKKQSESKRNETKAKSNK
ncbi:MAG: DUF2207 family protein [Bacillota bacterium]